MNGGLLGCRGSLGFGEDSVQSLPGKVGKNDVADCIAALDAAAETGAAYTQAYLVFGQSSQPVHAPGLADDAWSQ